MTAGSAGAGRAGGDSQFSTDTSATTSTAPIANQQALLISDLPADEARRASLHRVAQSLDGLVRGRCHDSWSGAGSVGDPVGLCGVTAARPALQLALLAHDPPRAVARPRPVRPEAHLVGADAVAARDRHDEQALVHPPVVRVLVAVLEVHHWSSRCSRSSLQTKHVGPVHLSPYFPSSSVNTC